MSNKSCEASDDGLHECKECDQKWGDLCPHGMPIADNVCGPCSEGRPNRRAPEYPLSSGDAIACIGMALQNPDTDEWPQLLRDCMHVIERMEGELLDAKRQRNAEVKLRQAAERAGQYTLRGWISPNPGCSELSDHDGGGWEPVYSRSAESGAELRELLLEATGTLFRWSCEIKEDGTVDWPEPEPGEAPPFIRDVGRKVEEALDVSWKKGTAPQE
jgi:hypothetical protein